MIVFETRTSKIEGLTRLDPEYYNPAYLKVVNKVRSLSPLKVSKVFNVQLGPAYSSKKIGVAKGIPIAKIGEVTNKRNIDEWVLLNNSEFLKFSAKAILKSEILLTLTGDPPDVGKTHMPLPFCSTYSEPIAFNQRVAKLKSKGIDPYYLFAFLTTEYFRIRFEQVALGIRQRNVSIPDLYSAYVFVPDDEKIISQISKLVRNHFQEKINFQMLMANAIRDLEKELGFDKLIFEKPKSYSSKFSEVVTHLRSDADFFQMKFRQLEKHIGTIETRTLSSLCTFLKGIEVGSRAYTKTGKLFVRVSNFNSKGLNLTNADKYISEDLYKRLTIFKPMKGDILLTKDGTIGMCYVMTEDIDGIISSGIFKMQLKDKSIPKEYLALAINSKFCQMQAERDCSGALILHWKPSDVKKLRIPILKKEKMKEFSETMIKAKHAKANSIKYLNEAKRIIEELIER